MALVTVFAALSLSACSLAQVGRVGVGVDRNGDPVLVMASCEGPARNIQVTSALTDTDDETPTWSNGLELSNPIPESSDPAAVSLVDPDPRWVATEPASEFRVDRVYSVRAWPTTEATLGAVDFTMTQLAEVGPGEVLRNSDDPEGYRIEPVADFIDSSLARCGK